MNSIPRLIKWIFRIAVFFLIWMTILRIGTYYIFKPEDSSLKTSLSAFWLGFRYDARIAGALSLVLLIIGSIPFLHPFETDRGKKIAMWVISLFTVVLIFFYVFDFFHYNYLFQRLNASALSFLEDAKISGGMVWQTYPVIKILFGVLIVTLLAKSRIRRSWKKAAYQPFLIKRSVRNTWFIITFLLCGLALFGRVGQYPLRWSDAFNLGNDFNANLALNPVQSFFSSLKFRSSGYDPEKVKKYYPLMAEYLGVDKPDITTLNFERKVNKKDNGLNSKPNIVLVICESFSAYKSSMWGNPLNTTPYFNELCKKGLFFDNCYTPSVGTARGVWATITGIPDVEDIKTASRNPSMVDQHTIINNFEGYEKYYFIGGSTSWANIRGLLMNNIDSLHLYEQDNYEAPKIDVWGISDKNLFLEANKILTKQTKPFFAVIQTADNHRPYTIPEEDRTAFAKVNWPLDSVKKYGFESNDELNAFRYTDFGYQKFIEAAKQSPYFDNTLFVFIGDHGINGDAGTMFPRAWTDNRLTSYHVPLLFYSPKLLPAQRLHYPASQLDVLPTIAGLSNISYTNTTLGVDLLDKPQKKHAVFIRDPNDGSIGVIKDNFYFTQVPKTSREFFVWADFNTSETNSLPDSAKESYRNYANAFYETAWYMLLNNKKKK